MLTPTELEQFKAVYQELLAMYIDTPCVHCRSTHFEDRHIVTCRKCGSVLGDFKTEVESKDGERRYSIR